MNTESRKVKKLQELLEQSRFTLVVSGAGISTASGIPDMHGLNPKDTMQFVSTGLLQKAPKHYYEIARRSFLDAMYSPEHGPSFAHHKLADMEKEGRIGGIITTNLDTLHELAGSEKVADIQGSFKENVCLSCGKRVDELKAWSHGEVPRCECGGCLASWPVYSHVALLPEAADQAREWAQQADLVLLIGAAGNYGGVWFSSLSPDVTIVQINPKSTQFDSVAALNIRQPADQVFAQLDALDKAA